MIIRAKPLPEEVTKLLEDSTDILKMLDNVNKIADVVSLNISIQEGIKDLKLKLEKSFNDSGKFWRGAINQIWAFGPRRVGPNLLLNRVPKYNRQNIWSCINSETISADEMWDLDNSIVSGFQLATLSGPLCEEPMRGVCFVIEKWEITSDSDKSQNIVENGGKPENSCNGFSETLTENHSHKNCDISNSKNYSDIENMQNLTCKLNSQINMTDVQCDKSESNIPINCEDGVRKKIEAYGPFSGQLISCIKDGCRKAFQTQSQRLAVAMYKCNIQATAEVLGRRKYIITFHISGLCF